MTGAKAKTSGAMAPAPVQLRHCMRIRRRPEGGGATGGSLPLPLIFENDDIIGCVRAKYRKIFACAIGAHIK